MKPDARQRTVKAYNNNVHKYAAKFDNYEVYQRRITDFQQKYITKGAAILDLGCGPANNINTLFKLDSTCTFTGVDLSEEFIRLAQRRFPQFTFLHQDINNLHLTSTYQTILASFCIVHLTDPETEHLFYTISELLEDNGCLYLSYMNGDSQGFESTSFSKEPIFFNYYRDEHIINLLNKYNLSLREAGKEDYPEEDGSLTTDTFIYAQKVKE